jgi:hypothetical protein
MRLRPRRRSLGRRSLAGWHYAAGPLAGYGAHGFARPRRSGRIRWWVRTGALLLVIGLVRVARAVRACWWRWLAGAVLTAAGLVLRGDLASGVCYLSGVLLLVSAVFTQPPSEESRPWLAELEGVLAHHATAGQRGDLAATLDRYPDSDTSELRDILVRQR